MRIFLVLAASFTFSALAHADEYSLPVYANNASCLADLSQQTKIFSTATGLSAQSALCEPTDTGNYALNINAAGTPARYLYTFTDDAVDNFGPKENPQWQQAMENDLVAQGAIVAKVSDVTTYYYAAQALDYSSSTLELFPSLQLCNSELAYAQKILAASGSTRAAAACYQSGPLVNLQVRGNFVEATFINDYGASSPRFTSLQECLQNRESVLQQNAAIGGFCVPTTNNEALYEVDSFTLIN